MGRGNTWTSAQDEALARAWVEISEDVLVGASQNLRTFWSRVLAAYVVTSGGDTSRTDRAVNKRWALISSSCMKFGGCYDQVRVASGMSDDDVVTAALQAYSVDHPKNSAFEMIDCWRFLITTPKFQMMSQGTGSQRSPPNSTSPIVSPPESHRPMFAGEERPMGLKRAQTGILKSRVMDVMAEQMKTQTSLQEKRQRTFQLTCGALLFSFGEDQIPQSSKRFFDLARASIMSELEAQTEQSTSREARYDNGHDHASPEFAGPVTHPDPEPPFESREGQAGFDYGNTYDEAYDYEVGHGDPSLNLEFGL